jgi:hypothetical protein
VKKKKFECYHQDFERDAKEMSGTLGCKQDGGLLQSIKRAAIRWSIHRTASFRTFIGNRKHGFSAPRPKF